MNTKTCKKCKETKPLTDFYKSKVYKWELDGHDYYCKYCRCGTSIRSRKNNNRTKKCSVEGCDGVHYAKTYCRNHWTRVSRNGTTDLLIGRPDRFGTKKAVNLRKSQMRIKYQLTIEQYEEMAKNGCHICGKAATPYKNLHVDHDHKCCPVIYKRKGSKTGTIRTCGLCVRGILCDSCNMAVAKYETGKMRDDYPLKNEVIAYVAKHDWLISDKLRANDKKQGNRKR